MPSRRSLLLGGAGVVAAGVVGAGVGIEKGVLPGRPYLQQRLGLDGEDGVIPDVEPGQVIEGSFVSDVRGGVETGWSVLLPPGAHTGVLNLVVALHWLGADHSTLVGPELGLDRYLAAYVNGGGHPFAIATVDGGRSYWHQHDGTDAGYMIAQELFLQLSFHVPQVLPFPSAFMGWSMGGYGALLLAGAKGAPEMVAAVASSPALWTDPDDASSDGFDDADEYRRYTVFGHQQELSGVAVRIDCGTGDPFYRNVKDYADGFPDDADLTSTFEPGGHTPGYWRRMLPDQLAFLGKGFEASF